MQETCNDIDEQLREFGCEDFKDKSRIIELPCKVGDVVYINPYGIEVVCAEVVAFTIALRNTIAKVITDRGAIFEYHIEHFGKTIFLTREEAEKALEKMK